MRVRSSYPDRMRSLLCLFAVTVAIYAGSKRTTEAEAIAVLDHREARHSDLLRFANALVGNQLLDAAHTALVTSGKVDTGYGFE